MESSHDSPSAGSVATQRDRSRVPEKEALRVQAAAVAAQQAALGEEECRLSQRRLALEQQEAQLSAHLEEKRRQLLELHSQVQQARGELHAEQKLYQQQVTERTHQLEVARHEVSADQQQLQIQRRRLLRVRTKLKHRWHRQWAAEREAMRRREHRLEMERRRLEDDRSRLQRDRDALDQFRLRVNGENELNRRELHAARDLLHQEQERWSERLDEFQRNNRALADGIRELELERRRWEGRRRDLGQEVEGLEARVQNLRQKLAAQEETALWPVKHRDLISQSLSHTGQQNPPVLVQEVVPNHQLEQQPADAMLQRCTMLESLAGQLADQRLHLAEHFQRLLQVQGRWQQDRDVTAAELDALGRHLEEREQSVRLAEARTRQHEENARQERRSLESQQAQWTAQIAAWVAERQRVEADLRAREERAQRQSDAAAKLHQHERQRFRRAAVRLRTEMATCATLRREYTELRAECQQRQADLDAKQQALAQQIMAFEQLRQNHLRQAANPAVAAKRLDRLRRRWAALSAAVEHRLKSQRAALQTDMAQLEQRFRAVQQWLEDVVQREAELSERETAWEQNCAAAETESARLRQEVHLLKLQRDLYEQQVSSLKDEIERVARLLIDDSAAETPRVSQAA
jgi:chromosome segregation ATPase